MKAPLSHPPDRFKDALLRCREVAECEYKFADKALGRSEMVAKRLNERIAQTLQDMPSAAGESHEVREMVRELGEQLEGKVARLIKTTRKSLAGKRPRLRKFTIALFGRTTVGKSTFREAITGGDGSSIGDGGQNTTKRVHEYEWRGIHILDTPGFGSFEGARFRQQALGAVSKSDLVIFLLSDDGIQKEAFEGMRDVLGENKPVFFVLNVKRDLTKKIHRERFLKNPESLLGRERIGGHFQRIKALASDVLATPVPQIFVLHAQAACMAANRHPQADLLYRASRMEELYSAIQDEVANNGPVRRLQTLLDGTNVVMEGLESFYRAQAVELAENGRFLRRRSQEFTRQASAFLRDQREVVETKVEACFQRLHDQVFEFIEENVERKDVGSLWKRRVEANRIDKELRRVQEGILAELTAFVSTFERDMVVDAEFTSHRKDIGSPTQADVWDIRRGFGRVAAATGALSAVAFVAAQAGAANIWNPVGWGLLAVSAAAGILVWFTGKKADRLAKEKGKARQQLHDQISTYEGEVKKNITKWLDDQINAKALQRIADDLEFSHRSMKSLASAFQSASRSAHSQVISLNARLLERIATISGRLTKIPKVKRTSRFRGILFRALCSPGGDARKLSSLATSLLREDVVLVAEGERRQVVRELLRPLRPRLVEEEGGGVVVSLTKRQVHKMGRRLEPLFSAARHIANVPIKLRTEG